MGNNIILKNIFISFLIAVFISVIFFQGFSDYLVADDWVIIHQNMKLKFSDLFEHFSRTSFGWYRPVFDIFIKGCSYYFGYAGMGYHLTILFLYLLNLLLIGKISYVITSSSYISFISAFLFGIFSVHSEPMFWISASNEIISAFFVLCGFYCYLLYRNRVKRIITYSLSFIFILLALGTKETTFFFPIMIPITDYLISKSINEDYTWKKLIVFLPFLLVQFLYVVIRISASFPYEVSFTSLKITLVIFFYIFAIIFSMPDNFGYLSSVTFWLNKPYLPLIVILLSLFVMFGLLWFFIKYNSKNYFSKYLLFVKISITWIVIAILPVLPLAAGRTAYLISIGYAWVLSLFIFSIMQSIKYSSRKIKIYFVALFFLLITINIFSIQYRAYYWRLAGSTVNNVINQIRDNVKDIPLREEIYIFNLPDHINRAYTFRNAFPTIREIHFPNRTINARLDTETTPLINEYFDSKNVFLYENGLFVKVK